MSAVNSLPPPSIPGAEQRPYEPSMEEILASIRRIIADDQPLPPVREPEAREPAAPEHAPAAHLGETAAAQTEPEATVPIDEPPRPAPAVDVPAENGRVPLHPHGQVNAPQFPEMPEAVIAAPPTADETDALEAAGPDTVEASSVVAPISTVHDHAYDEPPADDAGAYQAPDPHRGRASAFHREPSASDALFSEATDHSVTAAFNALAASRLADNSEELLGIAREMIRPLLKAWIDDNLPSMVERMVRAEIERVARGGR